MFDLCQEYLSISEVARLCGRADKPLDPATVWRWILDGRGAQKTKLASLKIGGRRRVSRLALEQFIAALNPTTTPPAIRSPGARTRASERAARELEKIGI